MAHPEDERLALLLQQYSESSLLHEDQSPAARIPDLYLRLQEGATDRLAIHDNLGIRFIQRMIGSIGGRQFSERDVVGLTLNRTWAYVGDSANEQQDVLFVGRPLGSTFAGLDNTLATIALTRQPAAEGHSAFHRLAVGSTVKDSSGADRVVVMNFLSSGLGASYCVSVSDT